MKVGFFGLGNMGLPMAINLVKAGFEVTGFDISEDAKSAFTTEGGLVGSDTKSTCDGQDCIITMLPSGAIVNELYAGNDGIFEHVKSGTLLIDCSTIAAEDAISVAAKAKSHSFNMIDAPVSGGTAGAQAGTLTFIVGGDSSDLDRAKPLLESMGKNIFHAGDSGAGQVAKICNNMLLAIHMIGTAEALNLGMKHDLDPKVLSDIMKASSGDNWSLQKYNPVPNVMDAVPSSKNYEGGFGTNLMLKDLKLGQSAAESTKSATPLGTLAYDLYQKHSENSGTKDFSSILNLIKEI